MTTTATFRQFCGNPYIACTAITMGTIASSRTSATGVPALFQLSASAVTCTGTNAAGGAINPYKDIEYSWEVTSGADTGLNNIALTSIVRLYAGAAQSTTYDLNTDQVGPEAAFRFFTTGTKTVTLTARAADGAGGYITNSTTINLTVTATGRNNHFWFDADSGNNANDGKDPWGFAIASATFTTATKRLVKAGEFATYDHTAATAPTDPTARYNFIGILAGTGVTAGLYEIAAKISDNELELVENIGGTNPTNVTSSNGPWATSGSVADGGARHYRGGTTATYTIGYANRSQLRSVAYGTSKAVSTSLLSISIASAGDDGDSDVCYHNIEIDRSFAASDATGRCVNAAGSSSARILPSHFYFSDCNFIESDDETWSWTSGDTVPTGVGLWNCVCNNTGATHGDQGIYIGGVNWFFVVGGSVEGVGESATLDHHIYPSVNSHGLFAYISFGAGTLRSYCINFNSHGTSGTTDYVNVRDNDMTGVLRAWDCGNATGSTSVGRNYVAERNAVHGLTGDGTVYFADCLSMTVRDNIFWGNTGGDIIHPTNANTSLELHIYKNRFYHTEATTNTLVDIPTEVPTLLFRDNDFYDNRAGGTVFDINFDQANYDLYGNRAYCPNKSGNILLNDGAAATWASYEVYDLDARTNTPDWTTPASGDFTPTYTFGVVTAVTQVYISNTGALFTWTDDDTSENLRAFFRLGTVAATYTSMQGPGGASQFSKELGELTNLSANTTYYYRVYATDGYDISAGTTEDDFTTQAVVPVEDSPLYGINGDSVNPGSRTALWQNPGNVNGDQSTTFSDVTVVNEISDTLCTDIAPAVITGTVVAWKIEVLCQTTGVPDATATLSLSLADSDASALLNSTGSPVVASTTKEWVSTYMELASGVTSQDVVDAVAAGITDVSGTTGWGLKATALNSGGTSTTFKVFAIRLVAVLAGGGSGPSDPTLGSSMLHRSRGRDFRGR